MVSAISRLGYVLAGTAPAPTSTYPNLETALYQSQTTAQ